MKFKLQMQSPSQTFRDRRPEIVQHRLSIDADNIVLETDGGGIYSYYSNITILANDESVFDNNSADRGGAIYFVNGTNTIDNITFEDNASYNKGGAIYFQDGNNNMDNII